MDDARAKEFINSQSARLRGQAVGFFKAAQLLFDDAGAEPWATIFVNLGFAIELGLKSYVVHRGGSERDIRKLGHDLTAALNECSRRGYKPGNSLFPQLIADISPTHKDHSVRYLRGTGATLPKIPFALAGTGALLVDIHEQSDPPTYEELNEIKSILKPDG